MLAQQGAIVSSGGGLPQGAVALLHFDNTLKDEVQGIDWTPSGTIGFTSNGKFNQALDIANDGYVWSWPTSLIDFAKRDFTISLFVRTPYPAPSKQILNKANFQGSPEMYNRSISLGLTGGSGNLSFYLWGGIDSNGNEMRQVNSANANKFIVANKRSYVKMGRKNGTNLFIVVDGVKSSLTIENNFRVNDVGHFLTFGGAVSGSNNGFIGDIDELLIQMDIGDDSLTIPTAPF